MSIAHEARHLDETGALLPVSTFFGLPTGDLEDLQSGSIAIAGLYCDHFGQTDPGARFAARQTRYVSRNRCDWDVPEGARDIGDLNVFPLEPMRHEAVIAEQIAKIAATGATFLVVGGDAAASPHIASGLMAAGRFGTVCCVRLSRRLDLTGDPSEPYLGLRRGCMGRTRVTLNAQASDMVFVGTCGAQPIEDLACAEPSTVITGYRLQREGMAPAIASLRDKLKPYKAVFLSIDADVVAAPLVGFGTTPTMTGMSPGAVLDLLEGLKGGAIVGAHLGGLAPGLNQDGLEATLLFAKIAAAVARVLNSAGCTCR